MCNNMLTINSQKGDIEGMCLKEKEEGRRKKMDGSMDRFKLKQYTNFDMVWAVSTFNARVRE